MQKCTHQGDEGNEFKRIEDEQRLQKDADTLNRIAVVPNHWIGFVAGLWREVATPGNHD
jgi:hypothetical protein